MFNALTCPQCGGPLPRQAIWRYVACTYCHAVVTRGTRVVQRAPLREAWERAQQAPEGEVVLAFAGRRFRRGMPLAPTEHAEVWRATTVGAVPERVELHLAHHAGSPLPAEDAALRALQALDGPGAAYFSQRLPQVAAAGQVQGRDALALRLPPGFDVTLDDVIAAHPSGIADPRHAVWLWRRALDVLGYLHGAGWTHGDLRPAHWRVHAADHGVLLTGWSRAQRGGDPTRDLRQSAWAIRELLAGRGAAAAGTGANRAPAPPTPAPAPAPGGDHPPAIPARVPAPLAAVLRAASEDPAWCRRLGAPGIDAELRAAAETAFGPPRFIPFNPHHA